MAEAYESHLEDGFRKVSQMALEEWQDDPNSQLVGVIRNIGFLERALALDEMNMFSHLLRRTNSAVKFYPNWYSIQRIASRIKFKESPHFVIKADSAEVMIWKPNHTVDIPLIPASTDELFKLNPNPYYQPLFGHFGRQTFMNLADHLHTSGAKLLKSKNLLAGK